MTCPEDRKAKTAPPTTGEIDDLTTDDGKNAAAGAHGRKGAS